MKKPSHPLTRFRLEREPKLSRRALADLVGTSRQTIYRIETGEQTPSLALVKRILAASGNRLRADDFLPAETVKQVDGAAA